MQERVMPKLQVMRNKIQTYSYHPLCDMSCLACCTTDDLYEIQAGMKRSDRYRHILEYFGKESPHVTTELDFGSEYQLLVATLLSAQCTDKRVNQVTPELFRRFPDAHSMAEVEAYDVLPYIRSVSYPNTKANHLVEMSRMLVEKYNGEVPRGMAELTSLPGVGRKTANVMRAVAFGEAAMPVDTHVFRVSHRLGLVPDTADSPLAVEKYLVANIPKDLLADAHHWLLLHGRYICTSRSPHCDECPFVRFCPQKINH